MGKAANGGTSHNLHAMYVWLYVSTGITRY